ALVWIVPVKSTGVVNFIRLFLKRTGLFFQSKIAYCIMDLASAVVIFTNGTVQFMFFYYTVERLCMRSLHGGASRFHFHSAFDCRTTGSDLFTVHFNDASIACLERSERFIIANLRDKIIRRIQYIKQVLSWFGKMIFSINSNDIM